MLGLIRRTAQKILGKRPASTATIIPRSQHCISRKHISPNALKVLYRLHNHGYQAFLVGGGVRDLMLGLRPKDFDIATNARPEQVKALFRNSRLIGRRFRIVHVTFGREIIEVATFRGQSETAVLTNDAGMVVRDNVYGSIEEDAIRRDFTVNALYYNIADFSVLDFVGGVRDLQRRQLNIIGDPEARYREDPVRMLRAVRLASKLGLKISRETARPIPALAHLLEQVPAARLWDECGKMFLSGHASVTWHKLLEMELAGALFPLTTSALHGAHATDFRLFLDRALASTDERIADRKPVNPAFLYAVMLWEPMLTAQKRLEKVGMGPEDAFHKACAEVIAQQTERVAIPRRFAMVIKDIWLLQRQLPRRTPKRVERMLQHPRFRAGYDFLVLRAKPGTEDEQLAQWWTAIQEADETERRAMLKALSGQGRKPRRRRRPRKSTEATGQ